MTSTKLLQPLVCLLFTAIPLLHGQSIDYDQGSSNSMNNMNNYNNPYTSNNQQRNQNPINSNVYSGNNPYQQQQPQQASNNRNTPIINPPPPIQPTLFRNNTDDNEFSITVQVQLRSYLNPQSMLDASRTCACSSGDCLAMSPQNLGFRCFFSFMIIVSSADSSVQYKATDFLLLNTFGQIDSNYTSKFSELYTFTLNNQPTAIDIFVHNLGSVINAYTKRLERADTVYHVDTFVHPLNSNSSVSVRGNNQMQQVSLVGNLLGTQLSLSYSVACKNSLIGPGCDLYCNSSTVNSNTAICVNRRTGFYLVCRWNSGRAQVTDCKNCPWGIRDNAYCMDESGGILEANHTGVVSEGFRTATIILGVLCGVFLLLIVMIIVICCLRKPKQTRLASRRGQQNFETEYLAHRNGDEIRPLNTGVNPNATFSTSASTTTPQPTPRNQPPSLSARPNKSVLRSPHLYQLPPAAHLSGGVNSLNSSFSSTVPPVPPSISADV